MPLSIEIRGYKKFAAKKRESFELKGTEWGK
jgi:hypothetical protein